LRVRLDTGGAPGVVGWETKAEKFQPGCGDTPDTAASHSKPAARVDPPAQTRLTPLSALPAKTWRRSQGRILVLGEPFRVDICAGYTT